MSFPRETRRDRVPGSETSGPLIVPPRWTIVPSAETPIASGIPLVILPGSGFGTGAHATTQLCLQAIAAYAPRARSGWRMLDFGSGSGILGIAAAKLGAEVSAVEIDAEAIAHARENARLNGVSSQMTVSSELEAGPFSLIVANILRAVLMETADALAARLAPDGALVLSGLVATDVPDLSVRYAAALGGRRPEVFTRGEWCALAWPPWKA